MGGRREVGLTDFQMNDVFALRLERTGTLKDFERGLDADPRHAFCNLHLSIISSKRPLLVRCASTRHRFLRSADICNRRAPGARRECAGRALAAAARDAALPTCR